MENKPKASEEQLAYAGVLNKGMWIGLALLVVTFIIYISGALPSYVPIEKLSEVPQGSDVPYWGMRAHELNQAFNIPTGWGWTSLVGGGIISTLLDSDAWRPEHFVLSCYIAYTY